MKKCYAPVFIVQGYNLDVYMANSESSSKEPMNEQAVVNIYGGMRADVNQIYSKITELETEVSEHSLVMNAIKPLDPSRRCYRLIGGVLVERTVNEVFPAVQRNRKVLKRSFPDVMRRWGRRKRKQPKSEAKYKIRITRGDGAIKDESGKKEENAQGVFVGPAGANE